MNGAEHPRLLQVSYEFLLQLPAPCLGKKIFNFEANPIDFKIWEINYAGPDTLQYKLYELVVLFE